MSTAAINSASANRQGVGPTGKKGFDGRKSVASRTAAHGAITSNNNSSAMNSLIKDESILSNK